jgi:hypothetical protein
VRVLAHTVFSGEERLAAQHLGEDAADTPDIDGLGVFLEGQHDFGGTVPSCGHIFGHEARIVIGRGSRSSETKIADLEIAVGIEKKVGWFEISVEDVGGVHGFGGSESLIDEVLAVVVGEVLGSNDSMHVGFHEFL